MEGEIWKKIDKCDYAISNLGRVKKLSIIVADKKHKTTYMSNEILLNGTINNHGYLMVALYINKKVKITSIHRLVAIYFIDKLIDREVVNHIDGNKLNNHYLNIEWATQAENRTHCIDKHLTTSKYTGVYNKNNNNKWVASIYDKRFKKNIHLGTFKTEEEASLAYQEAVKERGYVNKYIVNSTL